MRFLQSALLGMLMASVPVAISAQHTELWEEAEPYPTYVDEISDFDIYAAPEAHYGSFEQQPLMENPAQFGGQYGSQFGQGYEASPLMGGNIPSGMGMEELGHQQQWQGSQLGQGGLGLNLGQQALPLQQQQWSGEFGSGFGSSWNQQEALLGGGLGSKGGARLRMPKGSTSTSRMVLPTITERGDRMINAPIQSKGVSARMTLPLIQRNKGSTTASPIYASPIIHNQIMDQNVIRPHYITQPVIRTVNMVQPIKSHRFVDQPIIQPVVTQPVLRRHFIDQNVVTNQIITQPVVQPSKTHQTFVRGRLVQSPTTSKQQVENIVEAAQKPIINQEVGETRRAMFLPLETNDLGQTVLEQAVQSKK